MPDNTSNISTIKGLEQGRAKFAYDCVSQVLSLRKFEFNNQDITTNDVLKKLFKDKFRQKVEINEKDNDERKKEKRNNNKMLDDFLEGPLEKMKQYKTPTGFIRDIIKFYEKTKKEYNSYVKKIPMMIKTNGLGATFAFMLSKGGTYKVIGEQVLEWLKNDEKSILPDAKGINSFEDLNKKIVSLNSPDYRALTIEILAFFGWLKRFAEGLIEGEAGNE